MAVNQTVIIGNLGKDPVVRETNSGIQVASLSVAVNEYRGKDKEPETHWYNVSAWGVNAKTAEDLSKGDRVVVIGKMVTRKWEDKEGNDRYTTELVATEWDGVVAPAPAPDTEKKSSSKSSGKGKPADDDDDYIPF